MATSFLDSLLHAPTIVLLLIVLAVTTCIACCMRYIRYKSSVCIGNPRYCCFTLRSDLLVYGGAEQKTGMA